MEKKRWESKKKKKSEDKNKGMNEVKKKNERDKKNRCIRIKRKWVDARWKNMLKEIIAEERKHQEDRKNAEET